VFYQLIQLLSRADFVQRLWLGGNDIDEFKALFVLLGTEQHIGQEQSRVWNASLSQQLQLVQS